MDKKIFTIFAIAIYLMTISSAMSIDYYFHPKCEHCKVTSPFVSSIAGVYPHVNFNFLDTSQEKYDISGTPTLVVNTNDCREIKLVGSQEIPENLECELKEMSSLNCETLPATSSVASSWFIK